MGGTARPLHDPGNHGTFEPRSLRQAARRGRLTSPARPAGNLERPRAPTPPPGARSLLTIIRHLHIISPKAVQCEALFTERLPEIGSPAYISLPGNTPHALKCHNE